MVPHLRRYDESSVAQERLRIIKFYKNRGERACIEAFGVGRKTIHVWNVRLKKSGVGGLVPFKTIPIKRRTMNINSKVFEYIVDLRKNYFRLGKKKIKPLLDEYCKKENLPTASEAKIGRMITKHKLFYQKTARVYHNPDSLWNQKRKGRTKRLRIKYAPKYKDLGHIQMDTIQRIENGIKYYLYSAVDISGKFALTLPYKTLTSTNTVDFFKKYEDILPYKVESVQTDNGLEFLGMFEEHLTRRGVKHLFTYPRCPRINGVVERYNRTVQEEFVDQNIDLIHNQEEFGKKLAEYLIFYNTKRVHQSLNYETPMDHMLTKGGMSKKYRACTIY